MTTVLEALNQSLQSCLTESQEVHFLGEDILEPYGGAFKVARGLSTLFPDRVRTTPVSEAGIVGIGIGMALRGLRPVVEIMFGDFLTLAADQLINHASKFRWMTNDQVSVPLVVRTPMGGYRGYGPTHSQTLEKHFLGVPGLRVLALSNLHDPGAILRQAILEEDDPVLLIEHKLLYRQPVWSLDQDPEYEIRCIPDRYPCYRLLIAGAPRPTLTIAAYGYMGELARQAIHRLAYERECFAELIVFHQLSPFHTASLEASLRRTGNLLTVEEGGYTLGWGAEIVARMAEAIGPGLRAQRLGARDLPIPAARPLEDAILPSVESIVQRVLVMHADRSG